MHEFFGIRVGIRAGRVTLDASPYAGYGTVTEEQLYSTYRYLREKVGEPASQSFVSMVRETPALTQANVVANLDRLHTNYWRWDARLAALAKSNPSDQADNLGAALGLLAMTISGLTRGPSSDVVRERFERLISDNGFSTWEVELVDSVRELVDVSFSRISGIRLREDEAASASDSKVEVRVFTLSAVANIDGEKRALPLISDLAKRIGESLGKGQSVSQATSNDPITDIFSRVVQGDVVLRAVGRNCLEVFYPNRALGEKTGEIKMRMEKIVLAEAT